MGTSKPIPKEGLLSQVRNWLYRRKQQVPTELQQAISDCTTLQQLLDLLFSTDFVKDEPILNAFDKRLEELEGTL